MYAPQGHPAVYFSVLASSVIIVAARAGLLSPCVVPALGLCVIFPEFLSDALFEVPRIASSALEMSSLAFLLSSGYMAKPYEMCTFMESEPASKALDASLMSLSA